MKYEEDKEEKEEEVKEVKEAELKRRKFCVVDVAARWYVMSLDVLTLETCYVSAGVDSKSSREFTAHAFKDPTDCIFNNNVNVIVGTLNPYQVFKSSSINNLLTSTKFQNCVSWIGAALISYFIFFLFNNQITIVLVIKYVEIYVTTTRFIYTSNTRTR